MSKLFRTLCKGFVSLHLLVILSTRAEEPTPLRIGTVLQPISSPLYLAEKEGAFAGLPIRFVNFDSGRDALEAFLAGQLDIAACAETPIVLKALQGARFQIVATVGSTLSSLALIGRTDRGITATREIRGKRLGLTRGTNTEFFLETLRVLHRIKREEIEIIDLAPDELTPSLLEGKIDGMVGWEPYTVYAIQKLGDRVFVDSGEGIYRFSWNLVTSEELVHHRTAELRQILRILHEAGRRIEKNPEIISDRYSKDFNLSPPLLRKSLQNCDLEPTLGQDLIVQLEGQARWFIQRDGLTNELPNFLRFISTAPLSRALPDQVNLVN